MAGDDVEQYIERSKSLLDESSTMGEKDIEFKIIQPLIEILGWDLYLDVESEYTVQVGSKRYRVDYALSIEDTPSVFIEAKGSAKDLNGDHRDQLVSYMRQAGTDWGLLTNGKKFRILRLNSTSKPSADAVIAEVPLEEIEQDWEIMEIVSKAMIQSGESHQLADQLDTRKEAVRKIRQNKRELSDDISEILVDYSNESLSQEFDKMAFEFIDDLVQNLEDEPSNGEMPSSANDILDILGPILPSRTENERQKRAKIVFTTFELLRQNERVERNEIGTHLIERYPDEFSEETSEFERHWVNYIRDSLSELPRIEQPARGATQIWRYVPPELDQELRVETVGDWILDLEEIPSGSDEAIERQQVMVQMAYNYLKEVEKAGKDDFEAVLPSYTAHYETFDGFWSYCLRDALSASEDVEPPISGHQSWYYIGGESGSLPSELNIEIEEWITEEEISGDDFTKKQRQALLQFAYEYLKEVEKADKNDFKQYFKKNVPNQLGRYNTFDGLWNYVVKKGMENAPRVNIHKSGKMGPTTYEYIGEDEK